MMIQRDSSFQQYNSKVRGIQSIGTKLLIVVFGLLLLQYAIIAYKDWCSIKSFAQKQIRSTAELKYSAFHNELNSYRLIGQIILDNIARDDAIIRAFAARDRQTLLQLTQPLFADMKQKYGAQQFHFHIPPAISFLRVQNPSVFGDDLSSFRATVTAAQMQRQEIFGLEVGVNDLGVRVVKPLTDAAGQFIGTVEYGGAINLQFIEQFIAGATAEVLNHGMDISIYAKTLDNQYRLISSNFEKEIEPDAAAMMESLTASGIIRVEGSKAIAYYPMKDFSDKAIGCIKISFSVADILSSRISFFLKTGLILVVILCLFIFAITFCTRIFIVKPVNTVNQALMKIAEGDLTIHLSVKGNDEIAMLSRYFEQTIERISSVIEAVMQNTDKMQESGNRLTANMTKTEAAVQQISEHVSSVQRETVTQSAGVTETAATIEQVIKRLNQLDENIEVQAESVSQSSAAVEEMVANIAAVSERLGKNNAVIKTVYEQTKNGKLHARSANEVVNQIAEKSESLLEASQIIQNIASRTNLLAMNAAIEAAHAGASGKGFAVVADEIRKLAEKSNTQGKQITAVIKDSIEIIGSLKAAGVNAEKNFIDVYNLVNQISQQEELIVTAMSEQESTSRDVLSAIRNINEITGGVRNASTEMLRGGEQVAQEMERLNTITSTINQRMHSVVAASEQIQAAVQTVKTNTKENSESIENLVTEVKKFTVGDI